MKNFKKLFSLLVVLTMILSLVSVQVFADADTQIITITKENFSDVLDPFINLDSNSLFYLETPDNVKFVFTGDSQKILKATLDGTNKALTEGAIKVTKNKTIYDPSDDSLYIQGGGVNKTIKYWWGYNYYMKTVPAADWIHELSQTITMLTLGYGAEAAVAGLLSWGMGAGIVGGVGLIHTGTLTLIRDEALHKNDTTYNTNGIRVKWNNVVIGTMVYRQ